MDLGAAVGGPLGAAVGLSLSEPTEPFATKKQSGENEGAEQRRG